MKKSGRSLIIIILLVSLVISAACYWGHKDDAYYETQGGTFSLPQNAVTGTVEGTAQVVYVIAGLKEGESQTVTCEDSGADYTMVWSADSSLPADTKLTESISQRYFSIDVYAVLRILDEGKCIERDPSDDTVHVKAEGYFDEATSKFVVLTCGYTGKAGANEVFWIPDKVTDGSQTADGTIHQAKGSFTCKLSDEMKYEFSFPKLVLK